MNDEYVDFDKAQEAVCAYCGQIWRFDDGMCMKCMNGTKLKIDMANVFDEYVQSQRDINIVFRQVISELNQRVEKLEKGAGQ